MNDDEVLQAFKRNALKTMAQGLGDASGALIAQLVIEGVPRTKKNHTRRVQRGKRIVTIGSSALKLWSDKAQWAIRQAWHHPPHEGPVEVCAQVYRDANRGDLAGYIQAVGDALAPYDRAAPRILRDDVQIRSWDGTRLHVDSERPRVEIVIRKFSR